MTDNRKHINGDFRKLIERNYAYVDKTGVNATPFCLNTATLDCQ